jgi:hypothetical protein
MTTLRPAAGAPHGIMPRSDHMQRRIRTLLAAAVLLATAACGGGAADTAAPLATIAVTPLAAGAESGAPIDFTYRFQRTPQGAPLPEDYQVFVHMLDDRGRLLWTDDHLPPVATSTWGDAPVTYQRTTFVPRDRAAGPVLVEAGLYSVASGMRVPLAAKLRGDRAYEVASFSVQPPSNAVIVNLDQGWHGAEQPEGNAASWRWSSGTARLLMRNPRRNVVVWVDVERAPVLSEQTIEWRIADTPVATLALQPGRTVHRVPISAERLGSGDQVEVEWRVSPTFVPATVPALSSQDGRELGVRLYHVYVGVQ